MGHIQLKALFVAGVALVGAAACGSSNKEETGGPGGSGGSVDAAIEQDSAAVSPDGAQTASPITISHQGKTIALGSTYYIPDQTSNATVALFSEQRDLFTIKNISSAAVTIKGVTLTVGAGLMAEEYMLQNNEIKPGPLAIDGKSLAAAAIQDFYIRFYPIAGGARTATFTLTLSNDEVYSFTVSGNGQTAAKLFSGGTQNLMKVWGGPKTDEMATTFLADASGNLYFAANATEIVDKFASDIVVGRLNADGTLGWAKVWNGAYRDIIKDVGQNGETGGTANAMSFDSDGNLYIAGSRSVGNTNNLFEALVIKLDPKDGTILWEKAFANDKAPSLAKHNAEAYALDATGKYVYVTGSTGSNTDQSEAHVLLLALEKADGAIFYKKSFEVHPTYNDRGYCIRQDGKGNAFIGGNGSGDAILLKVGDIETATPKLVFAKKVALGTGGNINSVDVDAAGNAYLALDRRGATTYFSAAKVDTAGTLLWAKTYNGGSPSDASNIHLVKVVGTDVYLGGRIAQSNFDAQMGDGLLLKLKDDGALAWSMFHFSGKGPDELAEHRVKGVAISGNTLWVGGQVYTGTYNGVRYAGYWYDGLGALEDYQPTLSDITSTAINELPAGVLLDASTMRKYADAPTSIVLQDAYAKKDGTPPDSDFFFTKFTMK